MTDQERKICEAISGYFEPKPTFVTEDARSEDDPRYYEMTQMSDGGFWWRNNPRLLTEPYGYLFLGLGAINYYNDEAANAKLLEAMPMGRVSRRQSP